VGKGFLLFPLEDFLKARLECQQLILK
jgi:hypothetical protein